MSDEYLNRRYHRQSTVVGTTGKKKKYLLLILLVLTASCAGVTYIVWSSGVLSENNTKILPHLVTRINQARHAANLAPVTPDSSLSYLAYTKSQEVKVTSLNYAQGSNFNSDDKTNILIVPKISWALSDNNFREIFSDSPDALNTAFIRNVLNPDYRTIGIGVSSDSYNYYIVTKWKTG